MKRYLVTILVAGLAAPVVYGQQAPDTILTHGKVITVDDQFRIEEAIAIRGDRFVAVGSNA